MKFLILIFYFPKTSHINFNNSDLQVIMINIRILTGSLYYDLTGVKLYTKTCNLHAFSLLNPNPNPKNHVKNFKSNAELPNKLPNEF